jgi:hypothetical protein
VALLAKNQEKGREKYFTISRSKRGFYRFQPKAIFGKSSLQKTFLFRFSNLGQVQGKLRAPLFVACYGQSREERCPLDVDFS